MFQRPSVLKYRHIICALNKLRAPAFAAGWALILVLGLVHAPGMVFGQSKKDLEEKRKKLIRDIEVTDNMLKKTTKTKEATFDRFVTLQSQIERRETLIETISAEIAESEASIIRTAQVIESLTRDIEKMQADYGRLVRNAYRRKMLSNPLLYILSAESLNQAFRRWLFLRKYDRFRKTQAEAIFFTKNILSKKNSMLEEARNKQENLLAALQGQRTALSSELVDKQKLLKTLEKDEGLLRQDLQRKQAAHEALNQAIERVIQEEIRIKVEDARRPKPATPPNPSSVPALPPTAASGKINPAENDNNSAEIPEDNTSIAFKQNRGNLPWPVESGFISRGFGRQKHPTLRNIEITNNGVDIRTDASAIVRAVFDGKVAGVQFIPGHDYTVILQHGNYYTVYSNLSETKLSKGSLVKAKQVIGRVSDNPITGASELHFELWHQKQRLNPAGWINK